MGWIQNQSRRHVDNWVAFHLSMRRARAKPEELEEGQERYVL